MYHACSISKYYFQSVLDMRNFLFKYGVMSSTYLCWSQLGTIILALATFPLTGFQLPLIISSPRVVFDSHPGLKVTLELCAGCENPRKSRWFGINCELFWRPIMYTQWVVFTIHTHKRAHSQLVVPWRVFTLSLSIIILFLLRC